MLYEVITADAPENDENATTAGGARDNPYHPVDPSKVRKHKLASKLPGGNREYTLRQRKVDEDTFSEERSFDSGIDRITSYNVCYTKLLRSAIHFDQQPDNLGNDRSTSLNVVRTPGRGFGNRSPRREIQGQDGAQARSCSDT